MGSPLLRIPTSYTYKVLRQPFQRDSMSSYLLPVVRSYSEPIYNAAYLSLRNIIKRCDSNKDHKTSVVYYDFLVSFFICFNTYICQKQLPSHFCICLSALPGMM